MEDGYKLIRQIGTGLAGPLWLADSPSGSRVAIRRFASAAPQGSDEWLAARAHFLQSARQAATLKQPRVARVLEIIDEGSEAWVVSEFLTDEPLSTLLNREKLSPEQANFMLRAMAVTLDYVHQSGVVHGDLKPSNIFVGDKRSIRLTDFAISPRARRNLRGPMPAAWVHGYLSPEHLLAPATIGPKSDQYALAAIAWHLYTGQTPFGQSGADPSHAILQGLLTPASSVNRSLPRGLDAAISRALARDPAHRYPSCTALVEELEAAVTPVSDPAFERKESSPKAMYAGIASLVLALVIAAFLLRPSAKTTTLAKVQTPPVTAPAAQTVPVSPAAGAEPKTTAKSPKKDPPKPKPFPDGNGAQAPAAPVRSESVGRSDDASASRPPKQVAGSGSPSGSLASLGIALGGRPAVVPAAGPQGQRVADPPIPIYGPDVPKGFSLVVYSRRNLVGQGISFALKDPSLGEMGAGDLRAEVRANGPVGKGTLSLEWELDGTPMSASLVKPGAVYEYRNEPSPGTYKVILRQDANKVAEYTFRITP